MHDECPAAPEERRDLLHDALHDECPAAPDERQDMLHEIHTCCTKDVASARPMDAGMRRMRDVQTCSTMGVRSRAGS